MIKRFQIEDLIIQDSSGVVFRALDTETGKTVAVRRFFPFGVDGGGLHAEEQTAYNIAVSRLSGLSHPALRSIICGGCDPVDGMPFIATEWVEGVSLQPLIEQGPLSVELATALITQALEVCELLSHVLAEEAVWVETHPQTIIIGSEASGRSFTFWISPLKWLGGSDENRGLQSIVTLTEQVMNWTGRIVNDQAGRGLGGWLKWLRNTAATTTLKEARESLAASVGAEPPPSVKKLVVNASKPPIQRSSRKSPLVLALVLVLLIALAAGWILLRKAPPHHQSAPTQKSSATARASQRAAELSAHAAKSDQENQAILAEQESAAAQRGGAIAWDDHELLVQKNGTPVIVEGVIRELDKSTTGKTIYLCFAGKDERNATRAGIEIGDATPESMIEKLKPFVGKNVRVSGNVVVRKISGLQRPDIKFDDVSAVRVVE